MSKVGHINVENLRSSDFWPFYPLCMFQTAITVKKSLLLNAISLVKHEKINVNDDTNVLVHQFEIIHK